MITLPLLVVCPGISNPVIAPVVVFKVALVGIEIASNVILLKSKLGVNSNKSVKFIFGCTKLLLFWIVTLYLSFNNLLTSS